PRRQSRHSRRQVSLWHGFWWRQGEGLERAAHSTWLQLHGQGLLDEWHHGRASQRLHLLWTHLLPKAEAHGARQDACESARSASCSHATTHGGSFARWWFASG